MCTSDVHKIFDVKCVTFNQLRSSHSLPTMATITRQGPIYHRITQKLTAALRPTSLTLLDETHLHATHAQSPNIPETHFNLAITSSVFEGLSHVERHRKIYSLLSEELKHPIHALSIRTQTPSESTNTPPAK